MSPDFDTLLDQCLARLQNGESVETILREFPDHAAHLRPLLEVATRVSSLPAPRARSFAYNAARQRMLNAVDDLPVQSRPRFWPAFLPDFSFLRQIPAQAFNLALIALLIIGLAWIFSSLDLDGNPAGKQTPTTTPLETLTPTGSPTLSPTLTRTELVLQTATPTFPFSSTLSTTITTTVTLTPTGFPTLPRFTPTPTSTPRNNGDEPTPTITPTPTEAIPTPTPTDTFPYPPPVTDTPTPEPTATPTETSTPEPTSTPLGSEQEPTSTPTTSP